MARWLLGLLVGGASVAHAQPSGGSDRAEPEGWNGLGTHLQTQCGADDTIQRYANTLANWIEPTVLPGIAGTVGTKACTRCLAADRAIRVLAPLALDAMHRPRVAARLRALPEVASQARAKIVFDAAVEIVVAPSSEPELSSADGSDALSSAMAALSQAADDAVAPDGKGCFYYEGGMEYESSAEQTIENLVRAGVPKAVARREALALFYDLVWLARSRH